MPPFSNGRNAALVRTIVCIKQAIQRKQTDMLDRNNYAAGQTGDM